MASGPYQSNLLRFLVGQYWQGLARHKRAVRETRSTIAWGSEIAAAAVLSPVVMVARASQKRLQTLKASATKLRLSLGRARVAAQLLDFSGFDRLLAVSDRLNLEALKPLLEPKRLNEAAVGTISSDVGNVAVAEVAITEAVVAEAAMARTLLAVTECLSPAQREDLTQAAAEQPTLVRWWRSFRHVVTTTLRRQMGPTDAILVGDLEETEAVGEEQLVCSTGSQALSGLSGGLSAAGKITGVASDLETRSLVLVKDYRLVWKGLTAEQQRQLHQKIEALLADSAVTMAEWQAAEAVLGEFALPSVRGLARTGVAEIDWAEPSMASTELVGDERLCGLAVPSVAFWVEVLRAVAWLQRRISVVRRLPRQQLRLAGGASALKEGRSFVARLEGAVAGLRDGAIVRRAMGAIFPWKGFAIARRFASQGLAKNKRDRKKALEKAQYVEGRDYIDASVVTATYVEHPLEKVLNWVDRVLLWLENSWRRLVDWLGGQS